MSSKRVVDLRSGKPRRFAPRLPLRITERRTSLRDRRRKKRLIIFLGAILAFGLCAWAVHALSYLPRFSINAIAVEGVRKMPPEVVTSYVTSLLDDDHFHFISRRNIFSYPKRALANALVKNYPRVRSAAISRASLLSNELVVRIEERHPFARWCTESQCYFLDDSGYIFTDDSDATEIPTTAYRFSGDITDVNPIGRRFASDHLSDIVSLLKMLESSNMAPTGASVQGEHDFFITLHQGFFIKASFGQESDALLRNLQLVLNSEALRNKTSELEYVDLRFGNRVFFKLKGVAESSVQ